MNHTYTPLIIEGKIYVVVDAPEKPNGTKPFDSLAYEIEMRYFDLDLAACTKYETLPEHAPYWQERIGQRVEVEIEYPYGEKDGRGYAIPPQKEKNFYCTNHSSGYGIGQCENQCGGCKVIVENRQSRTKNMAIPPQQKQGDEWEIIAMMVNELTDPIKLIQELRNNYNLTKK